jgi:hypothetical protein
VWGLRRGVPAGSIQGWGDELGQLVGPEPHCPVAVVDQGVVALAEQRQVLQGSGPAVDPVDDVMRDAPGKRFISRNRGNSQKESARVGRAGPLWVI